MDALRCLISEILGIYKEIDGKSARFQLASGLRCPAECGICCQKPVVECSVVEVLPLAEALFLSGEAPRVMSEIERRETVADARCVLYLPDTVVSGNGRCGQYPFRPMMCRLFGFACRRNRLGELEFCPCSLIKGQNPEGWERAVDLVAKGVDLSVYQDLHMRLASLHPGLGYRNLPVNLAIKQAIEYLFWKKPIRHRARKAA